MSGPHPNWNGRTLQQRRPRGSGVSTDERLEWWRFRE